jgi:hypothetical protein
MFLGYKIEGIDPQELGEIAQKSLLWAVCSQLLNNEKD